MDDSLDTISGLRNRGFKGFCSMKDLRKGWGVLGPPPRKGIYLVIWERNEHNWKDLSELFLDRGTWRDYERLHTQKDVLKKAWVKDALIIYVGANLASGNADLSKRIKQLIDFGNGNGTNHRGGCHMWQIKDAQNNLQVCWKPVENNKQRDERKQVLGEFERTHQCLPFANING